MFRKKRVLIVGGAGFIGGHLRSELNRDSSLDVWTQDIQRGANEDARKRIGFSMKYDTIVLLAWNQQNNDEATKYNGEILDSLALYMNKYPRTHVIFASSAAVYPDVYKSVKENDTCFGMAPSIYGSGKYFGELMVKHNPIYTIFRFSNVFGKGGHGVLDQWDTSPHAINGDGTQVRDFVHVSEVVNVIHIAIKHARDMRGIFNLSSGIGTRIIDQFNAKFKGEKPKFYRQADTGVKFSVLDRSKLDEKLWKLN